MNATAPRFTELDPGDFDRLGVHPQECRLTVIRRAATRAARAAVQANARRTADLEPDSPEANRGLARELSLVAASTYRLLDPRRRADATERAHIGRILPGALLAAGHTNFHTTPFATPVLDSFEDDLAAPVLIGDSAITETVPHHEPWATPLAAATGELSERIYAREWVRDYEANRPLERIRRWVHQPQIIIGLIAALLLTSGWLFAWRRYDTPREANAIATEQSPTTLPQSPPPQSNQLASAAAASSAAASHAPDKALAPANPPATDATDLPATDATSPPATTSETQRHATLLKPPREVTLFIQDHNAPSPPLAPQAPTPQAPAASQSHSPSQPPRQARVPAFTAVQSESTRKSLLQQWLVLDFLESPNDLQLLQITADQFLRSSTDGSLEQWSGEIIAAAPAWISGDFDELYRRWETTSAVFDVDFSQFLLATYSEAAALPCSTALNARIVSHALAATQFILAEGDWDACDELVRLSRVHSDDTLQWDQLADAIKQARRTGPRLAQAGSLETTTASDATVIGRHLCFISRDWTNGLPWLVRCSDARLAGLAKIEQTLIDEHSPVANEWSDAAKAWLRYAEGLSGYSQQVIQLHAADLLTQALTLASPIEELRLTAALEQLQDELPKSLVVANEWTKQWQLRQTAKQPPASALEPPPETASTTAATPSTATTSSTATASSQPSHIEPLYLSGRVFTIDGVQGTLALRYQVGATIDPEDVAVMRQDLRWPFTPLCLDVAGTFNEPTAGTVVVRTQVSAEKLEQAVYLDDQRIEIDPLKGSAQHPVAKGEHRLRWVVNGLNCESLFLSLER